MTTQHSLVTEGARVAYYVSGEDRTRPPLVIVGSPMDSTGFGTLAGHFPDRTVVRVDPRNTGRSTVEDPSAAVSLREHAADLHAIISAVGGPVDVFGSSGGAAVALALVTTHPEDVRTLVAHEPPMARLLPDADELQAFIDDMLTAYQSDGLAPAMSRFIALVMHRGPVTPEFRDQPLPDPAMFGLPAGDDGDRNDPLMRNFRGGGASGDVDLDALRSVDTRIVVAVGEESGGPEDGEMAGRSAHALAAALDREPVIFPGGHNGFLGGEFGQTGRPDEFGAKLREVLDG